VSNYRYSWRYGWKWAWGSKTSMAWLRTMWLSYVIGWDGESCQDCGHRYILWWADASLYLKVHGTPHGLLCPNCFDKQAQESGIKLKWIPEVIK
jgi:hypothetical protein